MTWYEKIVKEKHLISKKTKTKQKLLCISFLILFGLDAFANMWVKSTEKTETNVTIKRHPKQHNYATETRPEILFNRSRFDVADSECEKKVLLFRNE